jgi:hypothetical protein
MTMAQRALLILLNPLSNSILETIVVFQDNRRFEGTSKTMGLNAGVTFTG